MGASHVVVERCFAVVWSEDVVAGAERKHLHLVHRLGDGQPIELVVDVTELVMPVVRVDGEQVLIVVCVGTKLRTHVVVHALVGLWRGLCR